MPLPPSTVRSRTASLLARGLQSLKFRIAALAIVSAVLAALASADLSQRATQADLERLLLENERSDGERMASMLGTKIDLLKRSLAALAANAPPELFADPDAALGYLRSKPLAATLFESLYAARPDGVMIARVEQGASVPGLPNVADRAYFQQALQTRAVVVSAPLLGRARRTPVVIFSVTVRGPDGSTAGVLGASQALGSANLISQLGGNDLADGSRIFVADRHGTVVAHPQLARVMGSAFDERGIGAALRGWLESGGAADPRGVAHIAGESLLTMTGVPGSDWVIVHVTAQAVAFAPLVAARHAAWRSAFIVGPLAGLLAGLLALWMTRPISRLHARAEQLLRANGAADSTHGWPDEGGEIGRLATAFQRVIAQGQERARETRAVLGQLQAVLDHAEVGIALTRNGRFELVSARFCTVFGSAPKQFLGLSTRTIYASDEAYEALSKRALPAFLERGIFDGELELARSDGTPFWAQMRGRAVAPGDRSQGTIWTVEDITERRGEREHLAWTSSHDALTGLANRAAFEVLLERATERAVTEPFCALFIDLDRFKQVNDTAGHAAGDALLRDIAAVIASMVRKSDNVARLGGDEFAVLLDRCALPQGKHIAEKIRAAVVGYRLDWEGTAHSVGASIGLVPAGGLPTNAAEVLRAADMACYAAKRGGRNQVAVRMLGI
jgi:diguanylate cyclase